jgi:hypothetical protein
METCCPCFGTIVNLECGMKMTCNDHEIDCPEGFEQYFMKTHELVNEGRTAEALSLQRSMMERGWAEQLIVKLKPVLPEKEFKALNKMNGMRDALKAAGKPVHELFYRPSVMSPLGSRE